MKINLVTSLNKKDILECLRLWSLQKTLKKRDFYVKIVDVKDTEDEKLTGSEIESFQALFPNYTAIASHHDFMREVENGGLNIVTGERAWQSRLVSNVGKALLLKGAETEKYAFNVGVGQTEYSFLEKNIVKQYFNDFTGISVSKEENKKYLSSFYEKDVEQICDSTLLLRANEYDEIRKKFPAKADYILLDAADANSELIAIANKVKEETKLNVICLDKDIAAKNRFKPERVVSPQKFLGVVKAAKYVITNSERSALFSAIFNRPFLYVTGQKTQVSVEELLKSVRLKGNLIAGADEYKDISQSKLWNGHALHKRLGEKKKSAYVYLDKITGIKSVEAEYVEAPTDILKKDCCGCYACEEVCPVSAIQMQADNKGYYFPVVNKDTCISCQLCKKSCVIQKPRLVEHKEEFPKAIAAYHKDLDTRKGSSSGAMFPGFAKHIIEDKHGYVAGAKYDEDMNVVSSVGSTMEEVKAFYGSKYCKSLLDGSYKKMKELLDQGQYVLFSGLPCECSGLRAFLRKDYEKLYICEIICHAGPSAKVFKSYVKYLEDKFDSKVTNVTFRQKKKGWQAHQTSMVVEFKDKQPLRVVNRTNNYYRIFANDYIARESCTTCRFTHLNRAGDVTIGDFWGIQDIHPDMYDNQGASFVLINNERGQELWDMVKDDFQWIDSSVDKVFKKNHSEPISYKIDRDEFFHRLEKGEPINELLEEFNDLKK